MEGLVNEMERQSGGVDNRHSRCIINNIILYYNINRTWQVLNEQNGKFFTGNS